jgi:hypothetical protein
VRVPIGRSNEHTPKLSVTTRELIRVSGPTGSVTGTLSLLQRDELMAPATPDEQNAHEEERRENNDLTGVKPVRLARSLEHLAY